MLAKVFLAGLLTHLTLYCPQYNPVRFVTTPLALSRPKAASWLPCFDPFSKHVEGTDIFLCSQAAAKEPGILLQKWVQNWIFK